MNYNVEYHDNFKKELKPLAKKYPSLKEDLQFLLDNFGKELALADDLGGGFRKIRLNIKSKRKGKKAVHASFLMKFYFLHMKQMLFWLPFTISLNLKALIYKNYVMH